MYEYVEAMWAAQTPTRRAKTYGFLRRPDRVISIKITAGGIDSFAFGVARHAAGLLVGWFRLLAGVRRLALGSVVSRVTFVHDLLNLLSQECLKPAFLDK